MREKDIAFYAIYADIGLDEGLERVKGYLGELPELYSNTTPLRFTYAPDTLVVNLETMTAVKVPLTRSAFTLRQDQYDQEMDTIIAACEAIE